MGRIKSSLCLKEKQSKKLIFDPNIPLRTEHSDTAQNPNFHAYFLITRLQCSQFLRNCSKIKAVYRFIGGRGESVD